MFTLGRIYKRPQKGVYLLMGVVISSTFAKGSPAQIQPLEVEPSNSENKIFATKAAELESPVSWAHFPTQSASPETASTPRSPQPSVINVESLPLQPVGFETNAETLRGTNDRTVSEDPSAIAAPNSREASFNIPEATAPRQITETVPYDLADYIPEPTPTPLIQVAAEVATPPEEFKEWRATLWNGVMTNNDFGESLTFQELEFEDSGLLGVGVSRTLTGGNSVKIEGELQLFRHFGRQDHYEGTAALALRWEMSPSLSIAIVEGVSYATALPEIEDDNNTDESVFLNYLALEIEYFYTPNWAIAGRLHHRSGAYGQFGGAVGGSNAYLVGLRRRF